MLWFSGAMSLTDVTPLHTAALPFILPWVGLVPHLEIVVLDPTPRGWARLLAGQGIVIKKVANDTLPEGCKVATGFDCLDGMTDTRLTVWAKSALAAFAPGGILVMGGTQPEAASAGQAALSPARAAYLLEAVGFARVQILPPAGPRYAVVAQVAAQGGKFDIFSPAFLSAPPLPDIVERQRVARVEADLMHHMRVVEERLKAQTDEIEQMRITLAELQRRVRPRRLSRLARKIKQTWRIDRGDQAQIIAVSPEIEERENLPRLANPLPLSAREHALLARLENYGRE
jgi:hypothetical protein